MISTKGEDKMMVSISKAVIGNGEVNSVDARELHAELGVKEDYSDWVKRRIEEAQLSESADFLKFREPNRNNRLTIILSLDSAKSIAMLERTDKGREVRQYFIECEKRLVVKSQAPVLPQTYLEALKALVCSEEQRMLAESQRDAAIETNQFFTGKDANLLSLTDALREIGIRPNKGISWLRELGYLTKDNKPTAKVNNLTGEPRFKLVSVDTNFRGCALQTKVTGPGLIWLREIDWPCAFRSGVFKRPSQVA